MTDKMRDEFEKWALTECFDLTAVGGFYSDNETDAAYKAWQACAARMVPEGFVVVPVEPTPEMLASTSWPRCAETDYKHMLEAAPDSTAATPSDKWVKCSERHPDKSGSYLVMLHEENSMGWNWDEPHIAEWDFWTANPRQWTIFCPDLYKNKEVSGDVTHWMPLPAAPEPKK